MGIIQCRYLQYIHGYTHSAALIGQHQLLSHAPAFFWDQEPKPFFGISSPARGSPRCGGGVSKASGQRFPHPAAPHAVPGQHSSAKGSLALPWRGLGCAGLAQGGMEHAQAARDAVAAEKLMFVLSLEN